MDRRTRRERTEKVATKRFNRLKQISPQLDIESAGLFKKNNGLTIRKESSRLWRKIHKKQRAEIDLQRHNPNFDSELE